MRQAIKTTNQQMSQCSDSLDCAYSIVDISLGIRDGADGKASYGLAEFMTSRQREELTEAWAVGTHSHFPVPEGAPSPDFKKKTEERDTDLL